MNGLSLSATDTLRLLEIDLLARLLPARAKILEIGGASGLQASALAGRGHEVTSVDVAPEASVGSVVVRAYDGRRLPFEAEEFDVVLSSNTLEHVVDLQAFLPEVTRVLRTGALAIHVMPSVAWRLWSMAAHYIFGVKVLARRCRSSSDRTPSSPRSVPNASLRRVVLPPPHGEFRSAFHEVVTYRRRWWVRQIEDAGLTVLNVRASGVFHTGLWLAPRLSLRARQRLSVVLGSGASVYVAVKDPPTRRS